LVVSSRGGLELENVMMIICNDCGPKDSSEFSKDSRKKNGCQAYCKPCAALRVAKAREANPEPYEAARKRYEERNPQRHLRCKIGITLADKRDMFEQQGFKCAACESTAHNNPANQGESGWCADHDHITKQFRGVLCWPCNVALGHAGDSADRLRALAAYLDNAAINTLNVGLGMSHELSARAA
jgi:hypothetical protein